jgi:hypothetical protein
MEAIKFTDQKNFDFVWHNNGLHPETGRHVEMKDALATSNATPWMPQVIERIVKEAAEPALVGTRLLTRIDYKAGQQITFPAVGALQAMDMAEGMEYPEQTLSMSGATSTATVGKVGCAVSLTEDIIRFSQYDVARMHMRALGRALARHKEVKIFNAVRALGTVCFDNKTPGSSMFGVTHGRDLNGDANGSLIMDDLWDTFAQVIMQGFTPNVIICHPLAWTMLVKDPVMRAIVLAGGNASWFASFSGNPAMRAPWDNSSQGGLGVSGGQTPTPAGGLSGDGPSSNSPSEASAFSQRITGAPQIPSYFPFPLTVVVSPYMHFDAPNRLTDIIVADSSELGALVVDHDPQVDDWTDPRTDIYKIKMKERYAVAILNEGKGVGVLKNVKVAPNEMVFPAQATISASDTFTSIPAGTSVV